MGLCGEKNAGFFCFEGLPPRTLPGESAFIPKATLHSLEGAFLQLDALVQKGETVDTRCRKVDEKPSFSLQSVGGYCRIFHEI